MIIMANSFATTEIVTSNEVDIVLLYLTGKYPENSLEILKSFKSTHKSKKYYEANSFDFWEYVMRHYGPVIRKRQINSYEELVHCTVSWCEKVNLEERGTCREESLA